MTKVAKTIPLEHEEQRDLVGWFNANFGSQRRYLFAIPNGAWLAGNQATRAKQANKLRLEGMRRGVPDLLLAMPRSGYHGLFIEMKRLKGGSVSEHQKKYIELLNKEGYLAVVCRGANEAKEVICKYLGQPELLDQK